MRSVTFSALLLALMGIAAGAAPAPPADDKAEADRRLDAVLQEWAKASDAVQESHFTIRVAQSDPVSDEHSQSSIEVLVRKPDLARIDFKNAKGGLEKSFVYEDRTVHWISLADHVDRYYRLPDDYGFPYKPDRYPDNFHDSFQGGMLEYAYWLAYGPPVRDLKPRFDLRLTKEDDNWVYLEIKPRRRRDQNYFWRMEIVLYRKSARLRRVWLEYPGGGATTYNLERPNEDSAEAVTPESVWKGLPENYQKEDTGAIYEEYLKFVGSDEKTPKP